MLTKKEMNQCNGLTELRENHTKPKCQWLKQTNSLFVNAFYNCVTFKYFYLSLCKHIFIFNLLSEPSHSYHCDYGLDGRKGKNECFNVF